MKITVLGSDHVGTALVLAAFSDLDVTLIVDDVYDLERLQSTRGLQGLHLSLQEPGTSDLRLGTPLALKSPHISLDWQTKDGLFAHVSACMSGQPLIETTGPDMVRAMAMQIGATLASVTPGQAPPSIRYRAAVDAVVEELLLTGSTPHDIDDALCAAGMAIGPFEDQDLRGLRTALQARRAVIARHGGAKERPLFARAVAEGRLGRAVGVGWYRYPGGGGKVEDPLVEDMAAEEAHFIAHTRRDLSDEDCVTAVFAAIRDTHMSCLRDGYSVQKLKEIERLIFGIAP